MKVYYLQHIWIQNCMPVFEFYTDKYLKGTTAQISEEQIAEILDLIWKMSETPICEDQKIEMD